MALWLWVCTNVCLPVHPKHACGQGLNERGPKRSRDRKRVRDTPPKTVGTYFEQLFHLVGSWSPAPLLLVLHSFVYWHFVMCCKWQPRRHMDKGTDSVCSWLVPLLLLHAGFLFHFEAFGKLLTSLSHQYWRTNGAPAPFSVKWKTCGWLQLTRTAFEIEIQSPWSELLTQCQWPEDWTSCLAIGHGQINWLQYLWLMTLADCVFNHLLTKLLKQLNESLPNAYAGSQRQLSLLLGARTESLPCI